jgi:hypothetical protein
LEERLPVNRGNPIAEVHLLPTSESLQSGLTEVLGELNPQVVHREIAGHSSTHPTEVVTCELCDGSTCRLLVKYSGLEEDLFGHKGGVPYEAIVYREVVSRIDLPSVRWYGNYHDPVSRRTWLILQFVENGRRLSKSAMPLAAGASWIGRFHSATRSLRPAADLTRYDTEYYAGWARRTLEFAEQARADQPWLRGVCYAFEELSVELSAWQPTIVHGEYYAKNILVDDGVVRPIDWESAAFGQGEVDIASLTEFWKPDVVKACEDAYVEARWPDGEPAGFRRMLGLARLYVHFRWLAVVTAWTGAGPTSRLQRLKGEAEHLELM